MYSLKEIHRLEFIKSRWYFSFTQQQSERRLISSDSFESFVLLSFRMTTLNTDSATRLTPVQHFATIVGPCCTDSSNKG